MKSYLVKVKAETESDVRGARPESLEPLIKRPDKDTRALYFIAAKAEVEKAVTMGDTDGAWKVIEKLGVTLSGGSDEYNCPLNVFQKDRLNGNYPFLGAHSICAAIRESAKIIDPGKVMPLPAQKAPKPPAAEHFRKAVEVRPIHIFFKRNGKVIKTPDEIQGQQPSKKVGGFARYEAILSPVQFEFNVRVRVIGIYEKTPLKDEKRFMEYVEHSTTLGIGGCRGVNYGQWKILDMKLAK